MLVFATSDKGGTGRTVTSSNIVYRRALQGSDVCYLDFDFGAPTAGAIFGIHTVQRGTKDGGLHRYIQGAIDEPQRIDVWAESERTSLCGRPSGAGELVLLPGDEGGSEFVVDDESVDRCVDLLVQLNDSYDIVLMDLSAGRSFATELALRVTARDELRSIPTRWLVFHRWTRQHVIAAHGLALGVGGILDLGKGFGHDHDELQSAIRFVRTVVVNPSSEQLAGLRAAQITWLRQMDRDLNQLAGNLGIGRLVTLGSVPLDPVLQWREQLITDSDTMLREIANPATVESFEALAKGLTDDWITI
ncbi:DNA-binding protein [Rhizocola hellebori]|uniref:DNA-binding protein n=1 Tax=Rhizocola hellebori TaxID=1392758 RepID=A0A8J3VI71_9ACTN|nr:SCO2523 family variant P-loop protein [Rhizocola hellebori]GIH07285.1 DNA-binding protein [Rhizocola hellebori]